MNSSTPVRAWPAPGAPYPESANPETVQDPAPVPSVESIVPKQAAPIGIFPLSSSEAVLSERSRWYLDGQPLRNATDLSAAQGRVGAISRALKNGAVPSVLRADAELESTVLMSAIRRYRGER